MVENMTEDQIMDLQEAFSMFDEDGSGSIDADELEKVLRDLGQNPSKQELEVCVIVLLQFCMFLLDNYWCTDALLKAVMMRLCIDKKSLPVVTVENLKQTIKNITFYK